VPEEDQGYFLALVELPDAATIERTQAVIKQVNDIALQTPGVANVVAVAGYNVIGQIKQPFSGFAFVILKPWGERKKPETKLDAIMAAMRAKANEIPQARVLIANAPSIPGLSATGGFKFEIQDLNDQGVEALSKAVDNFIGEARKRPELTGVYTTFNPAVPQRYLDVDRTKAKTRKVSITDIFDTLQINLGTEKINFLLVPKPAHPELSILTNLRVSGSVLEPHVAVDKASVLIQGAKALSFLAVGPLGLLAPFVHLGANKSHPCDVPSIGQLGPNIPAKK